MTDTATTEEMPPEVKEELEKIVKTTKRGFDVQARVKGRGLRKATITLFLDEELGIELGWAYDIVDGSGSATDALGRVYGREREGVIGELEAAEEEKAEAVRMHKALAEAGKAAGTETTVEPNTAALDERIAGLEARRDELIAELTKSAIVVKMRAIPPVMQKNCRRLAKQTLGITEKGIPEDRQEEFKEAHTAHLMTLMFQSVTDNETGEVNTETTYEDAVVLTEHLPPGQFERLDMMMGKVQYTDAISRQIEGQEDFS